MRSLTVNPAVSFLIRQHKRALGELASAEQKFVSYDKATSAEQREKWQKDMDEANLKRMENPSDPSTMDILNPSTNQGICISPQSH
jgi:hypothetical protein